MFRDRPHRSLVGLTAALLATMALAACSGNSSSDSAAGSSDSSGGSAAVKENSTGQPGSAPRDASGTPAGADSVDPAVLTAPGSTLARRATVALKVKNLVQTVAAVRSLSVASDGVVLAENIGTGGGYVPLEDPSRVTATTYAEITLSVPSARLDTVMAELGKLGTVIRSQSSSEEVGKQIVDTESRLKTMRSSVDRVRALMTKATDLTQVVTLEAEVSRRQADLEALEAQLAALENSVARSPVQISLTTESNVIAAPQGGRHRVHGRADRWVGRVHLVGAGGPDHRRGAGAVRRRGRAAGCSRVAGVAPPPPPSERAGRAAGVARRVAVSARRPRGPARRRG